MRALRASEAALAASVFKRVAIGEGAQALPDARRLAAMADDAPDARHALALCAAQAGSAAEADAEFRAALALVPGHPVILANRARFLHRQGQGRSALELWRQIVGIRPQDPQAWLSLGLLQLELSSAEQGAPAPQALANAALRRESVASLRRVLELDPGEARGWHGLGSALRDEGALDEAEHALRRALELQPEGAALWSSLAGVLRLAGRPHEAVEAYRRAGAAGDVSPETADAEVGALIDCLRIDEARSAAQLLISRHPAFAPAYTTLSHLNWEYGVPDGEHVAPEDAFRQAAAAQPDNLDLQLALVGFLLESKQGEEAFDRLKALRERAEDPRLVALQANALEIAGQAERAAPLYAEADRSLGARDVGFNNAYVRHFLKSGQWRAAAQRAERALSLDPHNQETWAYLATAWRLLGDPREGWLCGYERLAELMAVDVPQGWRSMDAFLVDLRDALEPLHRARAQPVAQSLRGGSQTPGRLFGRPDPRIGALQGALVSTIERWLAGLPRDPTHPFLARRLRSVRFTGSWSVKLWQSGSHANHFHSEGWMSSAFYVALPRSVEAGDAGAGAPAGALQLGQPPSELELGLAPRRVLQPRPGHLALFPSYLWHGTVPFEDAEPRITVAFDMLPRA